MNRYVTGVTRTGTDVRVNRVSARPAVLYRWDGGGIRAWDKSELEAYGGTEINHGRLYPNLDTLIDKGYLTKRSLDDRTNEYELTDEGRAVLAERREWEAGKLSGTLDN